MSAAFLVFLIALILRRNLVELVPVTPPIFRVLSGVMGICMIIAGIAAFVTGAISFFKFKDRSFVVILAMFFGFIAILFFIMELAEGIIWRLTH